jgi:hypothetical protein
MDNNVTRNPPCVRAARAAAAAQVRAAQAGIHHALNPVNLSEKFEAAAQADLEEQMNNMDIIH